VSRYFGLVLATLFWAGNFNVAALVVRYLPPFTSAAVRFTLAVIVVIGLVLARERLDVATLRRHLWAFVALGVIGVFGFNVLFFAGLKYTSPVNGSLIMAINPLLTAVLSAFILGDRLRGGQILGLLLSLVGLIFVITGGSWTLLASMRLSRGDGYILLACACWATYGVLIRRFLSRVPPLTTTAVTMVIGTLLMLPFGFLEPHQVGLLDLPLLVWLGLLFMAIPGSVLAYLFWNRGMATLGPARTSIFFNLVPVFTAAISVATGDRVSAAQVLGGAVVIAGCVLFQLSARPRASTAT
jgi:drug/metabolite transporter (DMT)-like permease